MTLAEIEMLKLINPTNLFTIWPLVRDIGSAFLVEHCEEIYRSNFKEFQGNDVKGLLSEKAVERLSFDLYLKGVFQVMEGHAPFEDQKPSKWAKLFGKK